MTKKDRTNHPKSSNPNDFFSDISDDLQMQVESLASPDAASSDNAPSAKEDQPSDLFSVPGGEGAASAPADEASLFDTGAPSPTNDTGLQDGVPYPAALSGVVLESTSDQSSAASSPEPAPTDGAAHGAETQPLPTDTVDSGEQLAHAESHEPTNADDTKTMAEQPPQEDQEVATSEEATADAAKKEETVEAEAKDAAPSEAADEATPESDPQDDGDSSAEASAAADDAADAPVEDSAEAQADAAPASDEDAASDAAEASPEEAAETAEAKDAEDAGPDDAEDADADVADEEAAAGVKVQQGSRGERESVQLEQKPFRSSAPDTTITHDDQTYVLAEAVEHAPDRTVWQAHKEGEDETILVSEVSANRYRTGYKHLPEIEGFAHHTPFAVVEEDERAYLLYEQPEGYLLQTRLRSPEHHWTIGQLRRFFRQITESVKAIHDAGYLCLEINEQHIWLDDQRNPTLYDLERLYTDRTPFHLRPICEGFSAPELYHQQPIGPYTDIFSLGTLLHYMISQCPAFNHLDLPNPQIPSPRIYQLDFPVGLDHVIERATHLEPNRRFNDVSEFMQAVERAFHEIEDRHRQQYTPLQLAIGHDIHIGINKGMRNPVNQDALFWRYDRRHNKGIFLIADGVSHCHYGSGDRASSILIQAARQCWDALLDNPIMEAPTDHKQRRQILNSIFEAANNAIATEVNKLYDQVEGYVEDVMGSTCVGGFLDGNQLTVTNLGDSRAYLKTDHYIEQISVDHDYKTAQLQIGQDVRSLQSLMGGSLITRCVGSCRKDEQLKVIPLQLQADFFDLTLIPGDTIVFCSDGLSDYAGESEEEAREMISKIVEVHTEPLSACFWLVALANQRGGGDNISVIELKVLNTL